MEFRKREVEPTQPPTPPEPPFTFIDRNGKEIRVPMETFRSLPPDRKQELLQRKMAGEAKQANMNGQYPAKPAWTITVVIEDCQAEDLGKVMEVKKSCPAKMPTTEDFRLPINTYIARYFILNGDEQRQIEDHWLSKIPSAQFKLEIENGLTEVHQRSIIDGKYGERMETKPIRPEMGPKGSPSQPPIGVPEGAMPFNSATDMRSISKPCASCGKNRYSAPSSAK